MSLLGERQTVLLEREDELAVLAGAFERATEGTGTLVVVEGAAGTGKSSLLFSARELARGTGLRVLSARGGELERDSPFGIMRQLYEPAVNAAAEPQRAELLAGAAAPVAGILGLEETGSLVHAAGFAAMRAFYWLNVRLSYETPTLLAVDDAHWADSSSLRALDYLARRLEGLPVMLIVALRPQEPGAPVELLDQLRTAPGAHISLSVLNADSVARLVRNRVPEASDELCAACHATCGGNPLYLRELLRLLSSADAPLSTEQVLQASVPSLAERVLRRTQLVDADAAELTRAMAVLGDRSRSATAAQLASLPAERAGGMAHGLRRLEVLAEEDPFIFVHPLIRRSIYDAIPETERQSMHLRAAKLLGEVSAPPEAIAAHLRVLTPNGNSEVASGLLAAAEGAMTRAAPDEAVGWLKRALEEAAPQPARVELLARLGLAKALQRDPTAVADLQEAYALAEEPHLRGRMAATLAEILSHAGRWADAIKVIEESERTLTGADPELETDVAALRAAVTLFDPAHCIDFDQRRPTYLTLSQHDSWAAKAIAALLAAEASHRGQSADARELAERALEGGRLLGERGGGAWATPHALGTFIELEEYARAQTATTQLRAAAQASGSVLAELTAILCDAFVGARLGHFATAEAQIHQVTGVAMDSGLLMFITSASFFLLDVLLEREGLADLADLVEQTDLGADFLSTASGAMLLEARGSLRLQRHDRARAIEDLRAAGAINAKLRFGPSYSMWRSSLALALPAAAREEALGLAREELELAKPTGLVRPHAIALRTLGILESGTAGLARLRESVELLESSPLRYEHGRSLVELGAALRRANQRASAREPLAAALKLAHDCGARRLADRAGHELQAAGGRRQRGNTAGLDSLTASELHVVQLAATGTTNLDIAQALYVSPKTVETHLYRAYGKLGLAGSGSRGRLADVLAGEGADGD